jgi:tetratricopeptide (TPR) repeat protein
MPDQKIIFDRSTLDGLDDKSALDHIAQLIDISSNLNRIDGLDSALILCDEFIKRPSIEHAKPIIHFFIANIWAARRYHKRDSPEAWEWEQPELEKELYHLRSAVRLESFDGLDKIRQCQILTNVGNALNTLGRFAEALEYWHRALKIIPTFGMAIGNHGHALMFYARALYDPGHAHVFMKYAHDYFRKALSPDSFFESYNYDPIKDAFREHADDIASHIDVEKISEFFNPYGYSLGRSQKEKSYRQWCLDKRLFLNPLNDLGSDSIAAQDILHLPNMVFKVREPPTLVGLFNQIKQEYCSARYLYYEGSHASSAHFADRDVLLYDTLDYSEYSISIERIKASYRMAYSLFDKLGFFINAYWALGIPENKVSFRSIWYEKQPGKSERSLRDIFIKYENWPLRGLFWLSKDLLDENSNLSSTVEPDSEKLRSLRNHIEHKYLRVTTWMDKSPMKAGLAYSIEKDDLKAKTLRLLKLARSGLIYLSLAVHKEEKIRASNRGDELILPIEPIEWKQ